MLHGIRIGDNETVALKSASPMLFPVAQSAITSFISGRYGAAQVLIGRFDANAPDWTTIRMRLTSVVLGQVGVRQSFCLYYKIKSENKKFLA